MKAPVVFAFGVLLLTLSGCSGSALEKSTEQPAVGQAAQPQESTSVQTDRLTADTATNACFERWAAEQAQPEVAKSATIVKRDAVPDGAAFDVALTYDSGSTQNADGSTTPILGTIECHVSGTGSEPKVSNIHSSAGS